MCKYLQNAPSVDKPTPGIFTFAANERLLIVVAARNSFATTRSATWAPKDKGAKNNFEKLTDDCLYLQSPYRNFRHGFVSLKNVLLSENLEKPYCFFLSK